MSRKWSSLAPSRERPRVRTEVDKLRSSDVAKSSQFEERAKCNGMKLDWIGLDEFMFSSLCSQTIWEHSARSVVATRESRSTLCYGLPFECVCASQFSQRRLSNSFRQPRWSRSAGIPFDCVCVCACSCQVCLMLWEQLTVVTERPSEGA